MSASRVATDRGVYLGIDVGSSGCKGVAIDHRGTPVATASHPYPTARPRQGWAEQDPADWTAAAVRVMNELTLILGERSDQVEGIAFDGPAHMVVLLDDQNRPLRPVIHWADLRSQDIAGQLWREHGEVIVDKSLQRPDPSWTLPQLMWVAEHEPEVWASLRRLLPAKDAVRRQFTGDFLTDPYDATGTQLYDPRAAAWSPALLTLADLGIETLPTVQNAATEAGSVSSNMADRTGVRVGTPVAVGSGDSMVEALAIGLVEPGDAVIKLGTAANVSVVSSEPTPGSILLTYPHLLGDRWLKIGATNSGAATFTWYRDVFSRLPGTDNPAPGDDWIERAVRATPQGSEGLVFHPYLTGERTPRWDSEATGSFVGITARHDGAHFARAVLEGVAYSIRDCLDHLERQCGEVTSLKLIGGGTRSPSMQQLLADVVGRRLRLVPPHAAAVGSALVAAATFGGVDDLASVAGAAAGTGQTLEPNMALHKTYGATFNRYRDIADALQRVTRAGDEAPEAGRFSEPRL